MLTLEESIKIAFEKSYTIKSANYTLLNSNKTLESYKLGLKPKIDLEFDVPYYYSSLLSQFNMITGKEEFYSINSTRLESKLYISQPLVITNGSLSFAGSLFYRNQSSDIQNSYEDFYTNFSVRLNQPLFVFNQQKADLEKAEINLSKNERNYLQKKYDLVYNVTSGFFRLIETQKQIEIAKEKESQTQSALNTAVNKYNAGLIAEVEMMQLRIDLASSKNDLLNSKRTYNDNLNKFKLLIGLDLNEDISVFSSLSYSLVDIDIDLAIKRAFDRRPDLLNISDDIILSEIAIDEVNSRRTFRADISINYGINKSNDKFYGLFREFLSNRSILMTLSIPVWDWGKNSCDVAKAKIKNKEQQLNYTYMKERIKNEIYESYGKLNSAKERLDVLAKTTELAEKSYNISLERFKTGTITSFDLQQMQSRLTDIKLANLNALIDYYIALADFEKKTLQQFR